MEVQVRDYGFSPAQQDEIWRRWREGQSFSLIGRALGAPPTRPRLVVTGEVTGGRDVNDVVELDVVRVEATG
ncbi:hypothetical protein [Streptomyces sp. NPDC058307]|uniref:hypothetical protein n=1 Tax=Streptomyces sp. NPDC058307 TaxID=3346439 RepID=UPI0036E8A5E2